MTKVYDCSQSEQLLRAIREAKVALSRGDTIVIPTDTVYGIAADAFSFEGVATLLAVKQRERTSPPPVLVANIETAKALCASVGNNLDKLMKAFWPGPLTIITHASTALDWDLGETNGTVALRIPDNKLVLEILSETGPLAVSSANITGMLPALNAQDAHEMLGETVSVYLDSPNFKPSGKSSTIIDARHVDDTSTTLKLIRQGAITIEDIMPVLPDIELR